MRVRGISASAFIDEIRNCRRFRVSSTRFSACWNGSVRGQSHSTREAALFGGLCLVRVAEHPLDQIGTLIAIWNSVKSSPSRAMKETHGWIFGAQMQRIRIRLVDRLHDRARGEFARVRVHGDQRRFVVIIHRENLADGRRRIEIWKCGNHVPQLVSVSLGTFPSREVPGV